MKSDYNIRIFFIYTCYIANVLYAILAILAPIIYFFIDDRHIIQRFFQTNLAGIFIGGIITLFTVIFWIYCFIIWAKFDRKITRLFLIFFFSCFYNTFYFMKIKKEKWSDFGNV